MTDDGVTRRFFLRAGAAAGVGATALGAGSQAEVAQAEGRGSGLTVSELFTEYAGNPIGVDVTRPRLAWLLESGRRGQSQTAYQLLVASSESLLARNEGDVWDNGKVTSAESAGVPYDGPALVSGTRYHWKVRCWDKDGRSSSWSQGAWWETGLFDEADWAGARWIGAPADQVESEGPVVAWEFDHAGDAEGWQAANNVAPLQIGDGLAATTVTGPDPFVLSPAFQLDAAMARVLRVRLRADSGSGISLYFVTKESPGWAEAKKVSLPIEADGQFHEYLIDLADRNAGWTGTATQIRLDLDGADEGTAFAIDSIGLDRGHTVHLVTGSPQLRKDLAVRKKVERARVHVSGLGYHVLTIDGARVGDSVLDPGVTVYDKTALYATHDVTSAVRKQGAHVLGVTLGRGFYGLAPGDTKYWGSAPWLGNPRLRLKLEIDYKDGSQDTVVSDTGWQVSSGPTTHDSVYLGETYDARLAQPGWDRPGFDASSWHLAAEVTAPTANLRSQQMEPIRVIDTLRAGQVTSPKAGTYVFKYPVVTAGWARLRVAGTAGTEITLRYGETLHADGTVDNRGDAGLTNGPVQTDRYLLRGHGSETWEPSFSYKGFQYVQVDGYPGVPGVDDVTARVVHSDVPSAGTFSSSDPLLNTIHELSRRTILNNLHSVMTDTPMFEKRGWLGDVNVLLPATIDNFGMHRFYRNWLGSIQDNQAPDGAGVELSPNPFPAGYTDPIWAGALVDIPWQLFQDYGDRDILEASYDSMTRYVDYLTSHSDGLIQQGFYGDWVSPATSGTFPSPPEGAQLTATAYFHRYAEVAAEAARELGNDPDAKRFSELAGRIKVAFNAKFLDRTTGIYRTDREVGYRQTSNAVPLSFGLVPADIVDQVAQHLVDDVRARGNHLNTGHAGTKELLPALTEQGQVDIAFAVATQRTYPSWGFWIDNGATTLWEAWETNTRSRDHSFLGSIEGWFYRDLAGIKPSAPGYARIGIRPHLPAGLDHTSASVRTVYGTVTSQWDQRDDGLSLAVTIPTNTTAQVFIPAASPDQVTEGQRSAATAEGVRFARMDGDRAVFEVGSGTYHFRSGR
jgi:alpha-L-rhamnosidase